MTALHTILITAADLEPQKTATVIANLKSGGFSGSVVPSGKKGAVIARKKCVHDASKWPAKIDLAVCFDRQKDISKTLKKLASRNTHLALWAGHGRRPAQSPVPLLGPGSLGIIDPAQKLNAWINPLDSMPSAGNLIVVSQLGLITEYFISQCERAQIGVGSVISTGSRLDENTLRRVIRQMPDSADMTAAVLLDADTARSAAASSLIRMMRDRAKGVCAFIAGTAKKDSWPAEALVRQAGACVCPDMEMMLDTLKLLPRYSDALKGPRAMIDSEDEEARAWLKQEIERTGLEPVKENPADFVISLSPRTAAGAGTKSRKIPRFSIWPGDFPSEDVQLLSVSRKLETLRELVWHSSHRPEQAQSAGDVPQGANAADVDAMLFGPSRLLSLSSGLRLSQAAGLGVVKHSLCTSATAAGRKAKQTGFPVDLYLSAPDLDPGHELSLPMRGIRSPSAAREAYGRLMSAGEDGGIEVLGVIVMPSLPDNGAEVEMRRKKDEGVLLRVKVHGHSPVVKRMPFSMRTAAELAAECGCTGKTAAELSESFYALSWLVSLVPGAIRRIFIPRMIINPSVSVALPYIWTSERT